MGLGMATKALLVHPYFHGSSFWNYRDACALIGAKYPAAPLGLITVAAMLPDHWELRLVDRNTAELTDADFAWADLVMIGAMLPQAFDAVRLVEECRTRGVPVVVGGPDPTSRPELYEAADFVVTGEAEGAIHGFLEDWAAGARTGRYAAPKFKIDVTATPIPRYDLLSFDDYIYVNVQFSRGCPFTCEFCDIIELYGRVPRAKQIDQVLAELDRLYALGYRGHVDFVDDNLIGNKKAVKQFLPHLIAWQKARKYPFEFSTEASLNLADDPQLLEMMAEAGFFIVFIGIESPDDAVLKAMRKKQNTRRDVAEDIRKIYAAGIIVIGGFIVGFDSEQDNVAAATGQLIKESAIAVAMVGLLYALPNTQLSRRLAKEGRLHRMDFELDEVALGDQCTAGLNFETNRPRADILRDYRRIVSEIYAPEAFFGRVRDAALSLRVNGSHGTLSLAKIGKDAWRFLRIVRAMTFTIPEARGQFWRLLFAIATRNPLAIKAAMNVTALYMHLGPFSQFVVQQIDAKIAEAEDPTTPAPELVDPEGPAQPYESEKLVSALLGRAS